MKHAICSVILVCAILAISDIGCSRQPNRQMMIFVQGGTFLMGSDSGRSTEKPIHSVTVSSFSIENNEVTYERWVDVREWALSNGYTDLPVGRNGTNGTTNHPVTEVNWYDVVKWCNARSEKDGLNAVYFADSSQTTVYRSGQIDIAAVDVKWTANGYRLPTEAEWEFAAQGGIKSHGDAYSGSNTIDTVAWYSANSANNTHPVGTKAPNDLGLFDISGNVWEWCWDWYGPYSNRAQTNPQGPTSGSHRLLRGGSWDVDALYCRVPNRFDYFPSNRHYVVGFRCVKTN